MTSRSAAAGADPSIGSRSRFGSIPSLAIAFVVLGIFVRLARYLLCFPLWNDEAMLAANFIDRGPGQLCQPLDHCQVAPLFFLWAEWAIVSVMGFSEYALRAIPFAAGVAALVLFARIARQNLEGAGQWIAPAILAASYYPIRHASEVKPYALDLLLAVLVLGLALSLCRTPGRARGWWRIAAVGPLAIPFSIPSIFVLSGVFTSLLPCAIRENKTRAAYGVALVAVGSAFLAFYFGFLRPHFLAHQALMAAHWREAFPPGGGIYSKLAWLWESLTGAAWACPIGGRQSGSLVTALFAWIGTIALCHRGRKQMCAVLWSPVFPALFAAALGRYPFGEHARVMQYLVPSVCLLVAASSEMVLSWFPVGWRRGLLLTAGSFYLILCLGFLGRDLIQPGYDRATIDSRAFARWFFREHCREGVAFSATEEIASRPDAGEFGHRQYEYHCSRRLFAPNMKTTTSGASCDSKSPVQFIVHWGIPREPAHPAIEGWLEGVLRHYELIEHQVFRVSDIEHYEVFRCGVKPQPSPASAASAADLAGPPVHRNQPR